MVETVNRYEDLTATSLVASSSQVYDDADRLTSIGHSVNAVAIDYSVGYDVMGRMTQLVTPDSTSNIAYDANHQLLSASATNETYEYDLNGNRESADGDGYRTDADNRMAFDGTYNYVYDSEGNRVERIKYNTPDDDTSGTAQKVTYSWDHRNRLTGMVIEEDQGGSLVVVSTADYGYNNENHRVFASIDTDGDGTAEVGVLKVSDTILSWGPGGFNLEAQRRGEQRGIADSS